MTISEYVNIYRGKSIDYDWYIIDHMKIWSVGWNQMGISPSCGRDITTVWLHHLGSNVASGVRL